MLGGRSGILDGLAGCNLCGELILTFPSTNVPRIIYHNALKEPKNFSRHNPWIYGRTADLDHIHFGEMWVWTCMARAVFLKFNEEELTFHLSGAGELQPTHPISLPRNENEMILWNRLRISPSTPPNPNHVSRLEYPEAFPMHERCWQLMARILDLELIKKNMDIFVRVMCEPHIDMKTRPRVYPMISSPKVREWLEFSSSLIPRFRLNTGEYRAGFVRPSYLPHMTRDFRGADPLNKSYVENLIIKHTAKYPKRKEKGLEPIWQPAIPTHTMSQRSQSGFNCRDVFLPTELILNIADYLNHRDIRNMLLVFPRWRQMIPESYWRRRFVDDNYLDNDMFPAAYALDWQYVYLKTDMLLRPSLEWRNREHILRRLEATKERFLQRLEQKETKD